MTFHTVPWMEKNKLFSSPSRVGLLWRRKKKIESANKRSYGNVKGLYVILFVFWIVTFWKCSLCSDVLIKIINNLFFHKFIDNSKQVDELNSHTAGICLSIFWTILLWTAFWRNKHLHILYFCLHPYYFWTRETEKTVFYNISKHLEVCLTYSAVSLLSTVLDFGNVVP